MTSAFDWPAIRRHYESGYTREECQRKFGFSNGAWNRAVARGAIQPRPRSSGLRASEKRRRIGELHEQGLSYSVIAKALGITKPTVAYHARRLGIPADERAARRYDWSAVQLAYDSGLSIRECAARFGFCTASWTAAVRRGAVVPRPKEMPLETLLVTGRAQTGRGHLKQRLLAAGLKQERCERCGISKWQGMPLAMQLHHVNGDGLDNRLENLELLCANCHSLTDTYGGRNGHRRRRH
jgi:hypothetical protein